MQVHLTEENISFSFETEEAKEWFEKSDWKSWVFFVPYWTKKKVNKGEAANFLVYDLKIQDNPSKYIHYRFPIVAPRDGIIRVISRSRIAHYGDLIFEVVDEVVEPPKETTIPITVEHKAVIEEPCYVYLMIDTTNGFHKIGISNKPQYREKTLQSEKPTIELVCAKQFPSRTIAEAFESALHKAYANKRLRGEWFNLSEEEVLMLKETLQ